MQYLYLDGENLVFMDNDTYEQIPFPQEVVGDSRRFLKENVDIRARIAEAVYAEKGLKRQVPVTEAGKVGEVGSPPDQREGEAAAD